MLNTPLYISETAVETAGGIPQVSPNFRPDYNRNPEPVMFSPSDKVLSYSQNRPLLPNSQASLIGIVSILGALYRDGYYDSYSRIASHIRELDADPAIRSIVLKVHSPGGTADGCSYLADVIANCSKPVIVHGSKILSAAYFIAAPADLIVIDTSAAAQIGSIGCLLIHQDYSESLKNQGVAVRIFRANGSEQKAQGNSYEPLSEAAAAQLQKVVDDCRSEFVGYVNRFRSGKIKSAALSGLEFSQKEAIVYGLADHIGTFEWTLKKAASIKKA